MMRIKRRFLYSEDEDVQVLGLPYKSNEVTMFLFLPKEKFGLAELEKSLTGQRMLELIRFSMRPEFDANVI